MVSVLVSLPLYCYKKSSTKATSTALGFSIFAKHDIWCTVKGWLIFIIGRFQGARHNRDNTNEQGLTAARSPLTASDYTFLRFSQQAVIMPDLTYVLPVKVLANIQKPSQELECNLVQI